MICLQRQRGFHFILSAVSPNARAARLKGTASISRSTLWEGQKKILSEVQFEVPPCRYLWGRGCSQCNLDCSRCWTSRCFLLSQAQPTANGEAAIQTRRHYSVGKALRHFFGQRSHYSTFSSLACAYIPFKRCVCLHLYSVVFVPGSYASTVLWGAWRGGTATTTLKFRLTTIDGKGTILYLYIFVRLGRATPLMITITSSQTRDWVLK